MIAPRLENRKSPPLPPQDFLILAQSAALCAADGAYAEAVPGRGEWIYVAERATELATMLGGLANLADKTRDRRPGANRG